VSVVILSGTSAVGAVEQGGTPAIVNGGFIDIAGIYETA
jgi:hypothetical protein